MSGSASSGSSAASDGSAPGQVRVGRLWMDGLRFDEALAAIARLVHARTGGAVFTPNVDHVVTAEDDVLFREAYERASLSLADGQALVWAARLLGTPVPEKISGSDLVWPLLAEAARRGWRVFFLGGAPGVADAAAARAHGELGVLVAGVYAGAVALEEPDPAGDEAAALVAASRADLLLVSLGAPKQERWIDRTRARVAPAVAVGVGGALDFVAGRVRRAPRWVSRAGVEWLYRLVREPRRLARRYLLKDPRFAAVLVRTALAPRATRVRARGEHLVARAPDRAAR